MGPLILLTGIGAACASIALFNIARGMRKVARMKPNREPVDLPCCYTPRHIEGYNWRAARG